MESESSEKAYPLTSVDYAKIEAVKARIGGLRMGMIASVASGAVLAFIAFFLVTVGNLVRGLSGQIGTEFWSNPFLIAVLTLAPFMFLTGYLSYIVDRHIERLSRGKFEPRIIIEE